MNNEVPASRLTKHTIRIVPQPNREQDMQQQNSNMIKQLESGPNNFNYKSQVIVQPQQRCNHSIILVTTIQIQNQNSPIVNDQFIEIKPSYEQITQNINQNNISNQEEIKVLKRQLEELKIQLHESQQQIQIEKQQIDKYEDQLQKFRYWNEELTEELNKSIEKSKNFELALNEKDVQIKQLNYEKQQFQQQIDRLTEQVQQQQDQQSHETQKELINQLTQKNLRLQQQNQSYSEEIIKKEQQFQIFVEQKNNKQLEIDKLNNEYQAKQRDLQSQIFQKDHTIDDLRDQIKDLNFVNEQLSQHNDKLKQIIEEFNKIEPQNNTQLQLVQYDLQQIQQHKKERDQKIRQSEEIMLKQKKDQEEQQKQQQKLQSKQQMMGLQKKVIDEYGVIQICFVIDTTGSMQNYKQQVLLCISETILSIKKQINYKIQWACVAYQDFKEYKQNKNKYNQLDFTENQNYLVQFLDQQKCVDGDDFAEDIKGAFRQMLNLQWSKSFKIAMLICDAPTHGQRYNGGMPDEYPNEDIEPELLKIMQNNIFLVAINFVRYTESMFAEFAKIYKKNDYQHLLTIVDLKQAEKSTLWRQLKSIVTDAAIKATQSNNAATYGKKNKIVKNDQNTDSPTQAILKAGDPYNFEKMGNIKVEKSTFNIYKINFSENLKINKDKLAKYEQIKKIPIATTQEGTWQCIKTECPFALGMIKKVYLLKKIDNNHELYVIKDPIEKQYNNINDAANDCRSHLLSQQLFDLFRQQLREKSQETNQTQYKVVDDIRYTDLLILEQKCEGLFGPVSRYYIAERFFKGEFKKYNNNFGFIEKEQSVVNEIAQAFSLYTYQMSQFNYIICDIQGIGNYFTDPAICTYSGNFDETDMGIEGQAKYILTFESRKQQFLQITQTLGIEVD